MERGGGQRGEGGKEGAQDAHIVAEEQKAERTGEGHRRHRGQVEGRWPARHAPEKRLRGRSCKPLRFTWGVWAFAPGSEGWRMRTSKSRTRMESVGENPR